MAQLHRVVPRLDASDVLDLVQDDHVLVEIEPPRPPHAHLALRFAARTDAEPTIAYVVDQLVEVNYLVVDPVHEKSVEGLLARMPLLTEEDLLRADVTDEVEEAERVVLLGLVAEQPWKDAVRRRVEAAATGGHEGLRAAAGLARAYSESLR